jgi:hypothetical protein
MLQMVCTLTVDFEELQGIISKQKVTDTRCFWTYPDTLHITPVLDYIEKA